MTHLNLHYAIYLILILNQMTPRNVKGLLGLQMTSETLQTLQLSVVVRVSKVHFAASAGRVCEQLFANTLAVRVMWLWIGSSLVCQTGPSLLWSEMPPLSLLRGSPGVYPGSPFICHLHATPGANHANHQT